MASCSARKPSAFSRVHSARADRSQHVMAAIADGAQDVPPIPAPGPPKYGKGRPPKKFVPTPFEYHEEVELTIDNLTNLGVGVGRIDGWVVMVPFTLPGERVRARVYRNHKNYSDTDLMEVLIPSPDRVQPQCALFSRCGGCQYQNLGYPQQLEWKRNQVKELLAKMADLPDAEVLPVIPSPELYGYRSKITPHFERPEDGRIGAIGFLQYANRFRYVDVTECPIAMPGINETLPEVREKVHAAAATYKKGATLLLRQSADGTVLTDHSQLCEERVGDLTFRFKAGDFFQNNPFILPLFVEHVRSQAVALGAHYLVDAYCGSGLFGLSCARSFKAMAGIEVSAGSIAWAEQNADANGIENATFHLGSAEAIFSKVEWPGADTVVVIDPPRKGCSPDFLAQLRAFGPCGVVYVSCNPATQMRDLVELRAAGYELTNVQPFDLFPQTRHLECVITCRKVGGGDDPVRGSEAEEQS